MQIRKRYIFGFAIIFLGIAWYFQNKAIDRYNQYNLSLEKLRSVTKLVVWEQDFMLNDLETDEKTYFHLFTTKESVMTTVSGKMGFHIDLSDTIHTVIDHSKDTVYISAPLKITYVSLDLGTLQQVKEASLDPTLKVDERAIIRNLDHVALRKYLPSIIRNVKDHPLTSQEQQLSKFAGKPVKILLTQMPQLSDWK